MSTSRKFRRVALFAAIMVMAALPSFAQNASGVQGTKLAQELLNGTKIPTYDENAGVGQGGSFNMGGVKVDMNEVAPGVSREQMSRIADPNAKIADLEQQGMDKFDSLVTEESVGGDAARALLTSKAMSTDEVLGDNPSQFSLLENHYIKDDPLGEAFADCKTTTTKGPGQSIVTRESQDYTCTIGRSEASCGRDREVELEWDSGRTDFTIKDRVSFNGTCENDVIDNQCTVKWECTDSSPRVVDGVTIDEATAKAKGLPLLYPGAPAVCWAAKMKVACPVCVEDEFGNKTNCNMVDLSQPEGNSCGAYASNAMCRAVGDTCILNGEDGSCSAISRRYTCEKQVVVKSEEVTKTNSCSSSIQCMDGSCNGGIDFNDKGGMSLQVAMAQMVVADTISSDVTRDSTTIQQADSSYTPLKEIDPNAANDGADAARQWGFDQGDRGATNEPPTQQLSAAEQKMMNEAQLFKGNPYTCQSGYGGLVNCCKATDSNAKELFWKIHAEVNRNNQAARLAQKGGTSGYQVMQQGGAGLSTLGANFTSMRDNVMGGGSGGFEGSTLSVWQQFMNRARQEIKPALSPKWACSESEFDLAVQREIGSCSYAGTYCTKKVLGSCLKKREAYCCFKSPMSKMLRASAAPGGQLTHGNPKQPDCSGIPFDEVDRIDWSVMDFNQLAGNMDAGGAFAKTDDADNASKNFTGTGASAAADGRKKVEDRTVERIESIDADAVQANIAADAERYRSSIQANVQKSPAKLSFTNGYRMVQAGQGAGITVTRKGSLGPASATVSLVQGAPDTVGFYSATVQWADGEVGDKSFRLNPPAGAKGRVVLELRASQGTVDGASLMSIDIQ